MLQLALKQLLFRKLQTTLILLGIVLGSTIYVLIAGIQLGMRQYIQEQLLNNTAHVLISGSENKINADELTERFFKDAHVRWVVKPAGKRSESKLQNHLGWVKRLNEHPDVLSFAPKLVSNAIISRSSIRSSTTLQGIVPSKQTRVTDIANYMVKGSLNDLEGAGNKIVLGSGVMEKIGAKVNDFVTVSIGSGNLKPFKIVGEISFGNKEIDEIISYAHIKDVQTLLLSPGRISDISVSLINIDRSRELARQWDLLSQDRVQNWEEANIHFMQMIRIQDLVRLIITFSLLVVAAFGVYNVLSIMIAQKKREIAILRAIGYEPKKILELFFIQGVLLGVLGAILGMILGYYLNRYIGSIDLGFKIGKGNHLLISYDPNIYTTAFWACLLASSLASFIPALTASRLSPMDIIRSE